MTISSALLSAPRTPSSTASRMTVNASSRRVPTSLSSYAQQVKPRPVVAGARSMSLLGPARSNAPKHPGGLRGLFSNAGEIVKGFIPGIAHFVGDVAKDALVVPHVLLDAAKGDLKPSLSRYLPATTSVGKSLLSTGADVLNPTRFAKAWREGTLVSKVLEDAGNVALVGGPIAKALGAGAAVSEMTASQAARQATKYGIREATEAEVARAGLPEITAKALEGPAGELARAGTEPLSYYTQYRGYAGRLANAGDLEGAARVNQIANRVRSVVTLGEQVGNAPAKIFTGPAKFVGDRLGITEGLRESVVSRLPPELRVRYDGRLRQVTDLATDATTRVTRSALEPAMISRELGLTKAEDRAALLSLDHTPKQLAMVDRLGEGPLADYLNWKYQDVEASQRPTVEDARTASKYSQRQLEPDRLAVVDKVVERVRKVAEERTQRALDEGLNPEHLESKIRRSSVDKRVAELEGKRTMLGKRFAKAQGQLDRRERAMRIQDAVADDLPDPTAMNRPEIRNALETVRGQLTEASTAYEAALDHGSSAQQMATSARVDLLLDQAESVKAQAGWVRPERFRFTGGKDPETGKPLGDYSPTGNPSPNEQIRVRQGTLAERHNIAAQRVNRLQSRIGGLDEQIAEVAADFDRKFQDRFHTGVNMPSIVRLTNAMFHGTARLPTLLRRLGMDDVAAAVADGTLDPDAVIRTIDQQGIELSDAARSQLEHSVTGEKVVQRIAEEVTPDSARRLNSPYRVKDLIDETSLPDKTMLHVEKAWDEYLARRAKSVRTTWNRWTEAIPARYRRAAMDAQRSVGALIDMAEEANRDVPGSGDEWLSMAEETMTTLQEMVDAGFDPVHLTGGPAVSPGAAAGRGYSSRRLTAPKQRGDYTMRKGFRELGTEGYARVEANAANNWVIKRRNELLGTTLGKQLKDFPEVQSELAAWNDVHPGEVMPPATLNNLLHTMTDEDGISYATMNPSETLTPDSMVVPKQIYKAFEPPGQMSMGWRGLGRVNKAFKTWVLPFSPRWQIGNAIGNVLQASMHAGVSPVELGLIARQIIKEEGGYRALWRKEGLAEGLPAQLTESGLTHGEQHQLFGGEETTPRNRVSGAVDKIARGSYKFNSTVDNLTRSAVFIAKLGEGEGTEAALRTTLRALGDYTKLSTLERTKIRQIFPFYSWLKHSMTATLRMLPTSPTRAAFYANLQNLYEDDPDLRRIIGQGFRVGNTGVLDFGSIIPLADFGGDRNQANPIKLIGSSLSPAIKFPLAEVFGLDTSSMDRLSRPGGQGAAARSFSPLTQFAHNPVNALTETAWQLSQQGPTQIRALRDLALGKTTRYSGTGYRTSFTNENRRSPWQLARILNMPNVKYDPRLQEGTE